LVLIAAAGVLAACAGRTEVDRAALNQVKAAGEAFVIPPPGGPAIIGVVERRYSNAIEQTIALSTDARLPGQNQFTIQLFGPMGREAGETALDDPRMPDAAIGREMRALLPGISMRRSPLYVQNGFGPFGYATGSTAAGDLCLYAWQRLSSGPSLVSSGSVQIRLRLCQARATEQSLLGTMYGFTVNASFADKRWNPFGPAPSADPRLGARGQPIRPDGSSGIETAIAPAPSRPTRPRHVPAPVPEAPPQADLPPPGAPVVPAPPDATADEGQVTVPPPPSTP
jgi:hypothetical protein